MSDTSHVLLNEAAEWRLISLLLDCPGEGWQEQVDALAAEVADVSLKAAAESARGIATEGIYHSTLGPGSPAAPREVSYVETLQPGHLLSELAAYYKAFAYNPITLETPDHVALEAGFIAYLRFKEAYAESRGDKEQSSVAEDAARKFIDDHLNNMAEPLAKTLAASGIQYLTLAAEALLVRVGPRRKAPTAPPVPVAECLAGATCCDWPDEADEGPTKG